MISPSYFSLPCAVARLFAVRHGVRRTGTVKSLSNNTLLPTIYVHTIRLELTPFSCWFDLEASSFNDFL